MNRKGYDKLTIREARDLTFAAMEVAERMVMEHYGSASVTSFKNYKASCQRLLKLAAAADARMIEVADDAE